MKSRNCSLLAFIVLSLLGFETGYPADEALFRLSDSTREDRFQMNQEHLAQFRFIASRSDETQAGIPAPRPEPGFHMVKSLAPTEIGRSDESLWDRGKNSSTVKRLKQAEMLSLSAQMMGMGILQAADAWHTGRRPFSDTRDNLRRAWTTAPAWDKDSYFYNYIGHPYTGAFTYNLMRSQKASPIVSLLFSCSQSLIWEFTLEATEQQPSIQDLLFTSNIGSLIGEGFHRLTGKLRENGLSRKEKLIVLVLNPAHLLNNGFR